MFETIRPERADRRRQFYVKRLLSAFARQTHIYAWHKRKLGYRPASALEGTAPFTTAQVRPDKLPSAIVAMDTIAAMEANGKLAVPPAFVNIVSNSGAHSSHLPAAPTLI
jgi:hypothetical protein